MAFDCLSVPLMSDNPEKSFSAGRDMITYRRSQLGSDIIEACAFLRSVYGPPVNVNRGEVHHAGKCTTRGSVPLYQHLLPSIHYNKHNRWALGSS
jgi:hypothetical protein